MVQMRKKDRKALYFKRMTAVLNEYSKCFVVCIDNVRSKQMQNIRVSLRGTATLVMGKNTMMKKCLRDYLLTNPKFEKLIPLLKQNVGFVFTNTNLNDLRDQIIANRVAAPAKAGAIAPCDVSIPPQTTALGPEKTSFFQALAIPTKITKGNIEILNTVHIVKEGTKVGASEATLLGMLKIMPFTYGLEILHVYDNGSVYEPSVLDIKPEDLLNRFMGVTREVAALSMAIGYPTIASVPHVLVNTFKNLLAISVQTDIEFKESEEIKSYLKDPSKFAVSAPAASAAADAPAAKKEEAKPESEDESGSDIGMGLFD